MMPLLRKRSASTVGLPRLSRISRAMILSIVTGMGDLFFAFAFRCYRVLGRVHSIEPLHLRRHASPDDLHELRAVVICVALGGNGLEEMYVDVPFSDAERVLGH